ncbi:MAG: hypothetical protein GF335_00475 [Candidatus Moranbacteria bacterium]|nr:hypothetical protein [Candidatus Moranbacteria bacterium]
MKKEFVNSTFVLNNFDQISKQKLYYWRKANLVNYIKAKTDTGTKFFYDLEDIRARAAETEDQNKDKTPILGFLKKFKKG